jgi:hypothetical protein
MTKHDTPPPIDPAELGRLVGAVTNLNDTMIQIRLGQKTREGIRQLGTDPRSLALAADAPGNPGLVSQSPGLIGGVNFRETSGVATVVRVLDGSDSGGALLWSCALAANGSITQWFLPGGISHTGGVYVQVTGGVIEGAVYKATQTYGGRA